MRISLARMGSVAENLELISGKISQVYQGAGSARAPNQPRLVAVSKTKPKEAIFEAYRAGHRVFGENYVQELLDKATDEELQRECPDIQWHFIGHCQSQKANKLMKVPRLSTIETVSSNKLATKLNNQAQSSVDIFVQVNTSGEANKNGLEPGEVLDTVNFIRESCPKLRFKGLMTIGALGNSMAATDKGKNPDFEILLDIRKKVATSLGQEEFELELSMGMSGDYEEAIRMGSTNIRVGSSIFGARSYPGPAPETSEGVLPGKISVESVQSKMDKVAL